MEDMWDIKKVLEIQGNMQNKGEFQGPEVWLRVQLGV
jgi:hypothetical protein